MKIERHYMIDGVEVPQRVYYRRQEFGEYKAARFEVIEKRIEEKLEKVRRSS